MSALSRLTTMLSGAKVQISTFPLLILLNHVTSVTVSQRQACHTADLPYIHAVHQRLQQGCDFSMEPQSRAKEHTPSWQNKIASPNRVCRERHSLVTAYCTAANAQYMPANNNLNKVCAGNNAMVLWHISCLRNKTSKSLCFNCWLGNNSMHCV